MFLRLLAHDPQRYLFVVLTVVISITLHELAHGWAAIRRGDHTPIDSGHMTGNPLVHMGPFSIFAMLITGIAWGQMPIDPTRMRARHAEALVAAAGPAVNLLLSFVTLTGLAMWLRIGAVSHAEVTLNAVKFLFIFGSTNAMLCFFNLMPVPPLDGSHILASFHRGYALLIGDPTKQGIWFFAFVGVFIVSSTFFLWIFAFAYGYTVLVTGDHHVLDTAFGWGSM